MLRNSKNCNIFCSMCAEWHIQELRRNPGVRFLIASWVQLTDTLLVYEFSGSLHVYTAIFKRS